MTNAPAIRTEQTPTTTDIIVALCPLAKKREVRYNKVASDDFSDLRWPSGSDGLNSAHC